MNIDPKELDLRRQTYAWIRSKFEADEAAVAEAAHGNAMRREQAAAALDLVERLRLSGDSVWFKGALNELTKDKASYLSLSGPNGQMVVNQIVNLSPDKAFVGHLLGEAFLPPTDDAEAAAKIDRVVAHCAEIRTGSHPHAGRIGPLVSVFWMLAQPERWPAQWSSAGDAFGRLGWRLADGVAANYLDFAQLVLALGDPESVLSTLKWFKESPWIGPDPTIEARIAWAVELREAGFGDQPAAFANADALLAPMRQAGDDLRDEVSAALDREVTKKLAPRGSTTDRARIDTYVRWSAPAVAEGWVVDPSYRLWFSPRGVAMALHPGYRKGGWTAVAKGAIAAALPPGIELVDFAQMAARSDLKDEQTDFLVGRQFSYEEFDWNGARDQVVETAARVLPVLQQLLSDGPTWGDGAVGGPDDDRDDALRVLFEQFERETGYPAARDLEQRANREALAASLAPERLHALGIAEFRHLMNSRKYGFAGNRSILNTTLADPDEEATQALVVDVLRGLLYGDLDYDERLDRFPKELKGLGISGATKLLAIAHPDRFLPIFPVIGPRGKLAVLGALGLPEPPAGSVAAQAVLANDAIRQALRPLHELADDPWGQMRFSFWLLERDAPIDETDDLDALLADATDACTLPPDSRFLHELHGLLQDKGQIVLYGPPGTGKTYVALKLAEALATDDDRRALVQFHPSMAYEDFMEGFRPVLRGDQLTYQLTEGPLIELANRAALDPRPHVLIIDEMNRANLPKVFGELLFLLEYRDRPVKLAYRATGDAFALPKNVWIIGTMNLADRSVGQIDAALRRRFAFVSFAPNDEQNGGLLRRWLVKQNQAEWPADLVDQVNDELEKELGHADLLIGPSYFMKEDLDPDRMGSIWRYAIEPLMSDLFHLDDKNIRRFGWNEVYKRFGPAGTPTTVGDGADGPAIPPGAADDDTAEPGPAEAQPSVSSIDLEPAGGD